MSKLAALDTIASIGCKGTHGLLLGDPPDLCNNKVDVRHVLHWDSNKFVTISVVKQIMYLAVLTTGSCWMLVCTKTACTVHLPLKGMQIGKFGCYMVSYATNTCDYCRVIDAPFTLQLAEDIKFTLQEICGVVQETLLLLLGVDVW